MNWLFFKWTKSLYSHPLQQWMDSRTSKLTAEIITQRVWLPSYEPFCLNCLWLALLMLLCWAFTLENEPQLHHHCRLHSYQGYYAQRGSSCSFKTCMLGIRDGQLPLSLVKAVWRGWKRYTSCNGDGKSFCCVILFTTIPCQGLLNQPFPLLMQ